MQSDKDSNSVGNPVLPTGNPGVDNPVFANAVVDDLASSNPAVPPLRSFPASVGIEQSIDDEDEAEGCSQALSSDEVDDITNNQGVAAATIAGNANILSEPCTTEDDSDTRSSIGELCGIMGNPAKPYSRPCIMPDPISHRITVFFSRVEFG